MYICVWKLSDLLMHNEILTTKNSDHCLLAAKIKLKLKVPKQSKVQTQYDLNTLEDSTVRAKYNTDIRNKFQMLRIEETEQTGVTERIEKKWNNIKESLTNATTNLSKYIYK